MKKKLLRSLLIIFLMLPAIAFAHFIAFPQETRCILIRFADFEHKGNIYYRSNTDANTIITLQQIQSIAEKKAKSFWKENYLPDHSIIFCNDSLDFEKYGDKGAPSSVKRKFGAYVVLQSESLDTSIVAHEISHCILYNNIGWYKTTFDIPVWFDEGLAMQTDERDYYSIDTLMAKKASGIQLPDVTKFKTASQFFAGDRDQIMLNYVTAKYVVHEWLKTHLLQKFIGRINDGMKFNNAYNKTD